MKEIIENNIKKSIQIKQKLLDEKYISEISHAADTIINCFKNGGKLLVMGNGGSASDSQHMVAELVARYKKERQGLPAIALTTNTSTITALANDYSYDIVFKRQIEALATDKDVVFGISTSGGALNVTEAMKKAKEIGAKTIGLSGKDGGILAKNVDLSIIVPDDVTGSIQESHIMIIHIICELVEAAFVC